MRAGYLLEFETPEALLAAVADLRARGYSRLEAYTPFQVEGLQEALGLARSPLSFLSFAGTLLGAVGGYVVQWFCNAFDYPLNVGGRPAHMAPAFVPITFEMGVLLTALG